MLRRLVPFVLVALLACTGGGGSLDQSGTSSSGGGSSGASSSGGTGGKQISAADFEQGCLNENDCVAVFEGDVCNTCKCTNAAIAKTAQEAYETASSTDSCRNQQPCAADCQQREVVCLVGKCAVRAPGTGPTDAGSD